MLLDVEKNPQKIIRKYFNKWRFLDNKRSRNLALQKGGR